LVAHALATPLKVFDGDFTGRRTQNYSFHVKVTQWMKAPGLLFLALYEKVPSLEGADVVTDIKIDCAAQGTNWFSFIYI
jgi:hypothetical protein